MSDLFGNPVIPEDPARTPLGRRRPRDPRPNGYAAPPGTGPAGETCGSCEHHTVIRYAKRYHKCALMRQVWTGGRATDILVRSPACAKWEAET